MQKGLFWLVDGVLVCVKAACDASGKAAQPCDFSSKSGENFNHRIEWAKFPRSVTHGAPFDFYPRGRVEIKNGAAAVWLHPSLAGEEKRIREEFGLSGIPVRFRPDHSAHYALRDEKRAFGEKKKRGDHAE